MTYLNLPSFTVNNSNLLDGLYSILPNLSHSFYPFYFTSKSVSSQLSHHHRYLLRIIHLQNFFIFPFLLPHNYQKRHLISLQGAKSPIFCFKLSFLSTRPANIQPIHSTYPFYKLSTQPSAIFSCRYVPSNSKLLIFRSCCPMSKICFTSEIPCFQAFFLHLLLVF